MKFFSYVPLPSERSKMTARRVNTEILKYESDQHFLIIGEMGLNLEKICLLLYFVLDLPWCWLVYVCHIRDLKYK